MIRHSSSFFISLFIHLSLVFLLLFFSKSYIEAEQETPAKTLLKLSCLEAAPKTAQQQETKKEVCAKEPKEKEPKKVPEARKEIKKEKPPEKKVQKRVEKSVEEKIEQKAEKETTAKSLPEPKNEVAEPHPFVAAAQEVQKPQKAIEAPKEKAYEEEYSEINEQKIVELLKENLYYPRSARKKNITGVVKVRFTLDVDAKVHNITVIESSSDILGRAAVKTIEDLSGKFPKPASQITLNIPIRYSLTAE